MSPSVVSNRASDFSLAPSKPSAPSATLRTLLLSPPSLSSHPERLENVLAAHDRTTTDIQMLDRLSLALVSLPESTYDVILLLAGVPDQQQETSDLLSQVVLQRVVKSLKPGGKIQGQWGRFPDNENQRREAILSGLVIEGNEMTRPLHDTRSVPLRLGKKNNTKATTNAAGTGAVTLNINGKRKNGPLTGTIPAGVGFVDFSDDLGEPDVDAQDSDDELIDENALLDEEDMKRPVVQPPECRPKNEAEDQVKRSNADSQLAKLTADDLAEVDFTVQGKVGSCGNCALGDAFRCDGCPYIGLPAFKPGEEVRILNDDVQL
ncbi:uncharacterized protein KY384_006956 [Bacidia gigantensis]|uniref:uncharacterized protein n=1 Tax=Bacidia gigantensis TaxID=2732470 RepID=UPI001D0443E7|nr:uncharacterized protein KY384_006956 [Bacidia gigantensis]KAG8528040.1 hypothetical protein KY384_006956 [Bacidia gigantensis]